MAPKSGCKDKGRRVSDILSTACKYRVENTSEDLVCLGKFFSALCAMPLKPGAAFVKIEVAGFVWTGIGVG